MKPLAAAALLALLLAAWWALLRDWLREWDDVMWTDDWSTVPLPPRPDMAAIKADTEPFRA